ncbi:helix-turn-helix domain-containing protein [Aquimarina hainanensis]|uniref:Helix-turn-helix domain-containing protein n=1 Tax=Aquimarina hainanensis TaxID=1578017 RepID=A0ABW5NFV8_9FLAO
MSKLYFIPFLILFSVHGQQYSQEYSYWRQKTDEFYRIHNDSTMHYAKKMQETATSSCQYVDGVMFEANAIYFSRDCEASKQLCKNILGKLDKIQDEKCYLRLKSHVLGRLMYIEKCLGNYTKALEYIEMNKKLLKATKEPPSKRSAISVLYQSALIYKELGRYQEAITTLHNILLDDATSLLSNLSIPSIYMALGDLYIKNYEVSQQQTDLDSAEIYYEKHFEQAKDLKGQEAYTKQLNFINKGVIAQHKGNTKEALSYFKRAKKIPLIEIRHFTDQKIDFLIAETFDKLKKPDSVIYYGNQFLKKNEKYARNDQLKLECYTLLANAHHQLQELQKAYNFSALALIENSKLDTLKSKGLDKLNFLALKQIQEENELLLLEQKKSFWFQHKIIVAVGLILLLIVIGRFCCTEISKKKKKKEKELLAGKTRIKETEVVNLKEGVSPPQTMQLNIKKEIVEKVIEGLTKLEKEKAFLRDDFNLNYIAKELGSNTSYVSKIINHHTEKTVKEYINNLRIQYIMKALREEPRLRKHSLDAIAKDVGYSNASSFSKIFKKNVGVCPSHYIRELKEVV